jgi:hypothetical protein
MGTTAQSRFQNSNPAWRFADPESQSLIREIQEIRDALEAFKAAVEAGEVTGFKDGGMRSHSG